MILPIVAFGDPVLKKVASDVEQSYSELPQLIDSMFETMENSHGVGLAAPQIGKSIRVFVVDTSAFDDEYPDAKDFREAFVNARITEEFGDKWNFNEGCLSIPGVREDVNRHSKLKMTYYDRNWNKHEKEFSGIIARVIQHEYDHIEGKLFVDHVSSLKKTLLKGRLNDISRGKVDVNYKMRFFRK
jgi:peptide deformylase